MLHALAQGGRIQHRRDDQGRVTAADCFTREGHVLTPGSIGGTVALFRKLKRRGLIASHGGAAYRITRLGLDAVRAQADQR